MLLLETLGALSRMLLHCWPICYVGPHIKLLFLFLCKCLFVSRMYLMYLHSLKPDAKVLIHYITVPDNSVTLHLRREIYFTLYDIKHILWIPIDLKVHTFDKKLQPLVPPRNVTKIKVFFILAVYQNIWKLLLNVRNVGFKCQISGVHIQTIRRV